MQRMRIGVLVSGGGTNLQAILDGVASGDLAVTVACVVSNRKEAYALKRAEKSGVEAYYIGKGNYVDRLSRDRALLGLLKSKQVDYIVLAGYLDILSPEIVTEFENRILNIHPSLIPKYCGKGYFGLKVHEAVIENGDSKTGVTVHYVDSGIDTGAIIRQVQIAVKEGDTPELLSKRVLEVEHEVLVSVLKEIADRFGGEEHAKCID